MTRTEAITIRNLLRDWSTRLRTTGTPPPAQLIQNVSREMDSAADHFDLVLGTVQRGTISCPECQQAAGAHAAHCSQGRD